MEKSEIKQIISEVRLKEETLLKVKIEHYRNRKEELKSLDEQIRLALVTSIFDEIELKLGL